MLTTQRLSVEPVADYVFNIPYDTPGSVSWSPVSSTRTLFKTYKRSEAFELEKDGWLIPHVKDFDTLTKDYCYENRLFGYYWTRNQYKDTNSTQLYIGYNTTFQYPVLRFESEKLAVVLVRYS